MRTNPRCVLKGIGIAAAIFLGFQLFFLLLMRIPEPSHTKILPRDAKNQPKTPKPSGEEECVGWDCDNQDKRSFHPRDIGRPKTKSPEPKAFDKRNQELDLKKSNGEGKIEKDSEADLNFVKELHDRVHKEYEKTAIGDSAKKDLDQNEINKEKLKDIVVPRGVQRSDAYKYIPDEDGLFTCLFSQVSSGHS